MRDDARGLEKMLQALLADRFKFVVHKKRNKWPVMHCCLEKSARFSHPQLVLAQIYRKRGDRKSALSSLRGF